MEQFIDNLSDVLDCEEEITTETVLEEIEEWDSLSYVAFVAMAKGGYGKNVVASDVRAAETVADLYNLVK